MPTVQVDTIFGYLGLISFLFGLFLVLAGSGIIKIQQVTVEASRRTWIAGALFLILGAGALWLDIGRPVSDTGAEDMSGGEEESSVPESPAVDASDMSAAAEPILYDSFDAPAFDGGYDEALWLRDDGGWCDFAQRNGALVITAEPPQNGVETCNLIRRPAVIPPKGSELDTIEARIQLSSDHNLDSVIGTVLMSVTRDRAGGNWAAICGLQAHDLTAASFSIEDYRLEEPANIVYGKEFPNLLLDRWYTFRLEVDPDTMTFTCLIDDAVVDSYTPSNAGELQAESFDQMIFHWREVAAAGTSLVDDFRVMP